jgi:hypothetical protein
VRETEWHHRWEGVKVILSPGGNIDIFAQSTHPNSAGHEWLYRIRAGSSLRKVQRHVKRAYKWVDKQNRKERRSGELIRQTRYWMGEKEPESPIHIHVSSGVVSPSDLLQERIHQIHERPTNSN